MRQEHDTFQTLIGTVKSRPGNPGSREGPRVSNPHRYGQKGDAVVAEAPEVEGFQTLIGTVKRAAGGSGGGKRKRVSNPHRYGQKHPTPVADGQGHQRFKPS